MKHRILLFILRRYLSHQSLQLLCLCWLAIAACSCSVTRHVPQGQSVVSKVDIYVDGQKSGDAQLQMALRQKPYRRSFGLMPISAWIWHNDTVGWWHSLRNRMGTMPTIYDPAEASVSERSMQHVMQQKGYLDAEVTHTAETHQRKTHLTYQITSHRPRRITQIHYEIEDSTVTRLIDSCQSASLLAVGMLLDRNVLDAERSRLTGLMRDNGYYGFDKEDVRFVADTLAGGEDVRLHYIVDGQHPAYSIRQVHFVTDYNLLGNAPDTLMHQTRELDVDGYVVTYSGDRCYLRDAVLMRNSYVLPGSIYCERAIRDTYSALSRLHILRYVNLRMEPVAHAEHQLDCFIYLAPQNPNGIQFELDGTNTAGDFGFAAAVTYQQRNLFRGSEALTTRIKGSYEALSGKVENLINHSYSEYAAEVSLDLPQFLAPFLTDQQRRRNRATTVIKASFSTQRRPEYDRTITKGGFGYKWYDTQMHHTWDVIDLSYVFLPNQSESFRELISKAGPINYSAYTSHLIMAMAYTLQMGNNNKMQRPQAGRDVWSLRISPEIAGNVLHALGDLAHLRKNEDGQYAVFNVPFEQYARFDVDWSYSHYLTDRSRLAIHAAGGLAIPYGNSRVMPFEKRYYSGGANSVRGWSVRHLGPGRYGGGSSSELDYLNQCGDIRLDASAELRSRLFWKLETALFVDAGNIWTIRHYDSQPEGCFSETFFKEIAASWGLGLRLVTDFVVLRLDWGFKAYDPGRDADEVWAIRHPFRSNHNTFHFAVGYPF